MRWIPFLIFIGMIIGMVWINLTYVQPYGMIGEGHDYCKALTQEGYFEGDWDTADHRNCTVGYEEGINKNKKWSCPFRENCFSYDYYDYDCELEIDMKDFGLRCVWGGLGYFATMLTVVLWGMVAMMLVASFMLIAADDKKETKKIVGVNK